MAVKSLLLDIDGVLVRDRLLLEHVKDNCVKYVASKLPEAKNPRDVNRILYMTHGHTARGLQKAFQVDASDFNEKVYDKRLLEHLAEVIYGTEFQQEAKEIHELTKKDWKVTLFTNSPIEWAGPVARAISDEVFVVCAGADATTSPLKPEADMYTQFQKHLTHIYIDDSIKNLDTARWLPNWHPILFNQDAKEDRLWCPQVSSVWETCLFVNSVDQWIHDNHFNS
jgi:FMN phosphatase YigB (HAD superfamily)